MAFGAMIKRLFGSGRNEESGSGAQSETYQGYTIEPADMRHSNGQYLTSGMIRKTIGDVEKEHRFVRADTHASIDQARSFSITKARQLIDEQGDRIFD